MSIPNYRDSGSAGEKQAYWMGFLDGGHRLFLEVEEGVKDNVYIPEHEQAEILGVIDWFYSMYGGYLKNPEAWPGRAK